MNVAKRLRLRRAIILLVLASFLLAACGRSPDATWPGMTADGQGVVYVAYGAAVIAVDVESNEQLWSYTPERDGRNAPVYAPPTVVDGRVVFGDFGAAKGFFSPGKTISVYSLDATSGSLYSNWPTSPAALDATTAQDRIVAPALVTSDTVFIGTADNLVFALDATTAQPVWPQAFKAAHSIWGQPAYIDGVVYVPTLGKAVYALDASDGSLLWETGVKGSVSDKVVADSDLVYVGSFDGHAYALDRRSGDIQWSAPAETSGAVWGAPAYADGVVYFANIQGNIYAVDAESGAEIWNASGAGYVVARPVTMDGKILIASAGDPNAPPAERTGELIAYDIADGSVLWRAATAQPLFTTPVIAGDTIVAAQESTQALLVYFNGDGDQVGTYALPAGQGQ